jgi:hypothetical protein
MLHGSVGWAGERTYFVLNEQGIIKLEKRLEVRSRDAPPTTVPPQTVIITTTSARTVDKTSRVDRCLLRPPCRTPGT